MFLKMDHRHHELNEEASFVATSYPPVCTAHQDNQRNHASAGDEDDAFLNLLDQVLGHDQNEQAHPMQNPGSTRTQQDLAAILEPTPLLETAVSEPTSTLTSPLIENFCEAKPSHSFWDQVNHASSHASSSPVDGSQNPPTKPKRPLSAYNLFFQAERKKLLEGLPDRESVGLGKTPRNSHGKLGFADMARVVSAKWKQSTPQDKEPYEKLAQLDTARYQREMKAFKQLPQHEQQQAEEASGSKRKKNKMPDWQLPQQTILPSFNPMGWNHNPITALLSTTPLSSIPGAPAPATMIFPPAAASGATTMPPQPQAWQPQYPPSGN